MKKITAAYARKWLLPTKKLIRWYEKKLGKQEDCFYSQTSTGYCFYCPWPWNDPEGCGYVANLWARRPAWWCKVRLPMLRRWEREMVKALKETR